MKQYYKETNTVIRYYAGLKKKKKNKIPSKFINLYNKRHKGSAEKFLSISWLFKDILKLYPQKNEHFHNQVV